MLVTRRRYCSHISIIIFTKLRIFEEAHDIEAHSARSRLMTAVTLDHQSWQVPSLEIYKHKRVSRVPTESMIEG